ncbi:unnamed protein product [Boreogadus saida]
MLLFPPRIKKHVAAVAALESEVGNPNAAVFGCMIEFRSVHHVSERTVSQRVVCLGGVNSESSCRLQFTTTRPMRMEGWLPAATLLMGVVLAAARPAEDAPHVVRFRHKVTANHSPQGNSQSQPSGILSRAGGSSLELEAPLQLSADPQ